MVTSTKSVLMLLIIGILCLSKITFSQESFFPVPSDSSTDSLMVINNLQSISKSNGIYNIYKPGEAILIQIFPDSSSFLNGLYKIDDSGCIDFPVIGTIQIHKMSPSQLIDTIKLRCIDYLPFPNIRVSPLMRLSLLGGFYKPGLYWIDSRNSIWDAVQIAGGLQREDGLKLLRWERDGKVISKNMINQFQSGASLQSIGFKSGDQLCVTSRPKTQFSFREHFLPFFTLFLTTLTTGITVYRLSQEE